MFNIKTLLAASALASTALAHFTLDYPTSRGFDDDKEPQFCGGFTTVEARQPFPLGQGPIRIDSHHPRASVVAFISTSENPTSFNDFNTTSSGQTIPLATPVFQVASGDYCFNVNLGSLNVGLTNGSLVTLQVQYDGGDGDLYQCTDLVLIDGYTVPANETCTIDAATSNATASSTTVPSSSATSSSGSSSTSQASTSPSASSTAASSAAMAQREITGLGLAASLLGLAGLAML
ncbi:hypothetical protein CI109_102438 [Kwoniella shandongensis]|uniref:Uncharacterized protein n=1 Tax=Kwoniella shandongensis TaxID=1734106 RepID=A0A5M6BZY6_9TREE|nr:uncharacterized protein CI109_003243 [Kwoniella shandongensis]KAA5528344.1 hypothetical protein CI109_003243 [Kwoniella shandongensis]